MNDDELPTSTCAKKSPPTYQESESARRHASRGVWCKMPLALFPGLDVRIVPQTDHHLAVFRARKEDHLRARHSNLRNNLSKPLPPEDRATLNHAHMLHAITGLRGPLTDASDSPRVFSGGESPDEVRSFLKDSWMRPPEGEEGPVPAFYEEVMRLTMDLGQGLDVRELARLGEGYTFGDLED